MQSSPKSFDPRTLARLKGLALRARHIVEGYVAGLHRSPFRGFSIEFAEHREYAPGDDLRYVDWKVFGRTDKFYLKQFEDETNLVCHLLLDTSESMTYRSDDSSLSKLEYAQCLAAALGWLVLQQQDAVGLATLDDQLRSVVRPAATPDHWRHLLAAIDSSASHGGSQDEAAAEAESGAETGAETGARVEPDVARSRGRTKLGPLLGELAARLTRRGVVILFSDLFTDVDELLAGLKHFRYRRHDVVIFHVLDPREIDFAFDEPLLLRGLEGLADVEVDARRLREAYVAEFDAYLRQVRTRCRSQSIDYQLMRTDRPFDVALSAYLASRRGQVGS